MELNVQYVTNKNGNQTAVQIPIRQWKAHQRQFRKLQQLTQLRKDLREAFTELDEVRRGKRKAKTLREFLDEF